MTTDGFELASAEAIIEEARNGRMFILVDAEDRENEGDLVIPAQFATPDIINFMAKHGRGLICLAMTRERTEALHLQPMAPRNRSRHTTAFTVSIEAREGITTGISAHDRARTVSVAIDPTKGPEDIVSPGHIFPLLARDGGVLVRAGHTEAAVDVARLAGANPSGVICEIMNEDGTMARLPQLVEFAKAHDLKIGTIADLIAYRRQHDRFIERRLETTVETRHGGPFRLVVYRSLVDAVEHVALIKGEIKPGAVPLVRMHKVSFADDVLGALGGRAGLVEEAIATLGRSDGPAVMVFIRETNPSAITERFGASPSDPPDTREARRLREYGLGAQILIDLGIRRMELLTTAPQTIVALDGYGLEIAGQQALAKPE
ncbi:MAG: 3,4-dihydroxy-2-butanone-4-phosphate synthase [Oceanicaulis sp.]|uniref:3,4-dihydroxy-2-butanone-4-phosphate synthase n=1 Tax=Glycocaulis sp. TaxID=1969725 RepID=UPI0025C1AEB9|nr:3,4-dihydroxy-2-butanone-4-phosphate synthase [Glycocaulis sp.]MCC5980717.1 3,4-dihydroxy-2-butanone-4-phosphate synthase [Oceanicaulis sp.]MCH8521096.1 3,4-dihydroxy-2-butanone-4-phosphate synthase [Glycocaulis sp.]